MKPTIPDRLIIFDGVCNLCNGTVQFIIKRDREKRFRFAPMQSLVGEEILSGLGLSASDLSTVVYIRNGVPYVKSTAVLRILKDLGWCWNLLYGLIVVPKCIRNGIYDIVAKKRYRWFGRRESCMVPAPDIMERFI